MPETFPNIPPDRSSTRKVSFRVLEADFGDGYGQTVGDGVQTTEEEWSLSFKDYSAADVDTIIAFLDARAGTEHFLWTPPEEVTAKKWKQTGTYDVKFSGFSTKDLKVKIRRVYVI